VEWIYQQLVNLEVDRSCFIVGVGGGIVCDITGFAASTYMRGLPFGFVSSTLLSQVDASVGGKNGVNFHGYKNMVGVFNQPAFVICDTEMLKTLPRKELICGLAEVVKHAVIGNREFFDFLEQRYADALNLDQTVMERLVYDSIIVKSAVVERDEREKGERRKLNFGHTLAHALEKVINISHGEAVSIGMVFAANLSVHRDLLSNDEAERIRLLLKQLQLPTDIDTGIDKEKIKDAIRKDKKREGRGIHLVLLKSIGEAVVREIAIEELEASIDDMYMHW
jgi:3-dehydroquinate synthase